MNESRRRLVAAGMSVVASGALLSGCGKAAQAGEAPEAPRSEAVSTSRVLSKALSFHYVGDYGVDETMNQQLEIQNDSPVSVVPVLSFEALDKNDQVLPQVR
ncbi:hypothetical protein [Actinacidiphila glaucinigra]